MNNIKIAVWGIYQGLKEAWHKGYRKVIMESDYAIAVEIINNDRAFKGTTRNIIENCKNIIRMPWEVFVRHIPKEQNRVADALTNMATKQERGARYFQDPPENITRLLREDELGLFGANVTVRAI